MRYKLLALHWPLEALHAVYRHSKRVLHLYRNTFTMNIFKLKMFHSRRVLLFYQVSESSTFDWQQSVCTMSQEACTTQAATQNYTVLPRKTTRIEWDNNFSTILPPASNRCWTCKTFRFFWILDFLFCNSRAKHEQWTCDGYMYIFEWLLHASGKIGFQWFCLLRKHSLLSIMWLGNEIHCVKIHIFCCFD